MSVYDDLAELTKAKQWEAVGERALSLLHMQAASGQVLFFLGLSELRRGLVGQGLEHLLQGRSLSPASRWGVLLTIEAYDRLGEYKEAASLLRDYLMQHQEDEEAKELIVKMFSKSRDFSSAIEWNARRAIFQKDAKMPRCAIVVQAFIKADTLSNTLESLVACSGSKRFSLFIIQDNILGSKKFGDRTDAHSETTRTIAHWLPTLLSKFSSVECCINDGSMGTAATCQKALDRVSDKYDSFVFFEDDCVVAAGALEWMRYVIDHHIDGETTLFVAGESMYLDAKRKPIEIDRIDEIAEAARQAHVRNAFYRASAVPSTCFGTTSEVWKRVSKVRGLPMGAEEINAYLLQEGLRNFCIHPIIPRVKDVGMTHELGYSVAHLGRAGVKEIKSTVLLAEADFDPAELIELQKNDSALMPLRVDRSPEARGILDPGA